MALIETYWAVGGYLSRKVAESGWGKGVVIELAEWLLANWVSSPFIWKPLIGTASAPTKIPASAVLLCRRKDDEVVEYALSRHLSPALVAEYETKMIPRQLLREKLHEWREMLETHPLAEDD